MRAETRVKLWLAFMLVLGTLMTLFWTDIGSRLMNQIVEMLLF
ncbi:MAG TPA: hypothetical protein VJ793_13820 [Anaerolineae bacterium]|nr:hypothetical protein [Anaerolineae bacterium]